MPTACESLDEGRRAIDRFDAEIVRPISERGTYVGQAARFNRIAAEAAAPDRVKAVVGRARALAQREGADPEPVADLYRMTIARFIATETELVRDREAR